MNDFRYLSEVSYIDSFTGPPGSKNDRINWLKTVKLSCLPVGKKKTFHTWVQWTFLLRLPVFLSCATCLSRFSFSLQKLYTKMKFPQLKMTFLCHNKSKYFSEADRHDNWDEPGQPGKSHLIRIASRVDRENLPRKRHLRWKMLR